jgi:hypothetical protein
MGKINFLKNGNRAKAYLKHNGLTISIGNSKIANNVGIFNLPPGQKTRNNPCGSCPQDCPGCYAKKSFRMFPKVRVCLNNNYLASLKGDFTDTMITLINQAISKYGINAFRIHTSGDFYSFDYVKKWERIIKAFPEIKFYGYTKTKFQVKGMNLVQSIFPCGSINYGDMHYVKDLFNKYHCPICPVTMLEKNSKLGKVKICGKSCTVCHTANYVLFIAH